MPKQTHTISFKKEVIAFMATGKSAYAASKHFASRDGVSYDESMFRRWYKNREKIIEESVSKKRLSGGGRKPALGALEEILADEIVDLRMLKHKVTRSFISHRAKSLASEIDIPLNASGRWVSGFLKRHGFTLRRRTNLTALTSEQLVGGAVDYMRYLQSHFSEIDLSKTLLMDEITVYFADARTQTVVDSKDRCHVEIRSAGFASMRLTAVMSVWADGRKAIPLVIHKGRGNNNIVSNPGPILQATQEKAWINSELLIKWIDAMFPVVDITPGKCIVWDSCCSHVSQHVKQYFAQRNIKMIVIPGRISPYLQASDIGIFRELKQKLCQSIDEWKNSEHVEYTKTGHPKPPNSEIVQGWVSNAWDALSAQNIRNSIDSAGFAQDATRWHIWNHDIYGESLRKAWANSKQEDIDPETLESLPQDDDVEMVVDDREEGLTDNVGDVSV